MSTREWHTERIVCPGCGAVTEATVEHTWPWFSYVHTCSCGYVIMEHEWERAPVSAAEVVDRLSKGGGPFDHTLNRPEGTET